NLYWALVDLPTPFLSLRAGLEGERMFVSADFEALRTATDAVSDSVIFKKMESYSDLFLIEKGRDKGGSQNTVKEWKATLQARAENQAETAAARARLIEAGLKSQLVNAWSPLHVALIDEVMLYEQHRDEIAKWLNFPFWQAKAGLEKSEADLA